MTMRTIEVPFVGPTKESRSIPSSNQKTINLYPVPTPESRTASALMNWPGAKPFSLGLGTGVDRGFHRFQGSLFKVSGGFLQKVASNGDQTSIGAIAGINRCIFSNDVNEMVITTGGTAYSYDGTTLSIITDGDLETPDSNAMLNKQFIYDGDGQRWVSSAVGDGTDIPAINYAEAESDGDDLRRVYTFRQILYLFGTTESTEPWFNSGSGNPPFDRVEGGIMQKGLHALHSVANTDQFIYFLADDKNVYRIFNYTVENITDGDTAHQFENFPISDDAIGMALVLDGQDFYIITFPSANKTSIYSETLNIWFTLANGADLDRHLMNSYAFIYNKHLVADHKNGDVLELDVNTFTDNGAVQIRQRDTAPINAMQLGLPGVDLVMTWFEVTMQVGIGLETGQGSDPTVMFSTSIDGGRNFIEQGNGNISAGVGGDYTKRVRFHRTLTFQDLVVRVRVSDPVFISFQGASIRVDTAGDRG